MSYRVDYEPEMKCRYPANIKNKRRFSIRPILICVFAVTVCYGVLHSGLLRVFVPGDTAVTVEAFSGMVNDIDAGEPVREAFINFCEEIIINAG